MDLGGGRGGINLALGGMKKTRLFLGERRVSLVFSKRAESGRIQAPAGRAQQGREKIGTQPSEGVRETLYAPKPSNQQLTSRKKQRKYDGSENCRQTAAAVRAAQQAAGAPRPRGPFPPATRPRSSRGSIGPSAVPLPTLSASVGTGCAPPRRSSHSLWYCISGVKY